MTETTPNDFASRDESGSNTTGSPTPAAQPDAPTSAAPSPTPQPQPQQMPQQNAAPAAPAAPAQPHPISKMFDNVFKMMSGGPIIVTDPDGSRREVQQSKGSMARAITAAALAGLFTPNAYRESAMGGQVIDKSATMANAGAAGMQATKDRQAKAQEITDQQNSRRLMSLQNTANQVSLSAAMAHQKNESLDSVVDYNDKMLSKPLTEIEKSLGQDAIWIARGGLTADQVMASGHNIHDANVFISGSKQSMGPNGIAEKEATYSIIKNDFKLKLNEEQTKELAKFDQKFQDVYQATGGNVQLPINSYIDRVHFANSLTHMEDFMNRLNTRVNGDDAKPIDLPAAFKKNPSAYLDALKNLQDDMAAGTGREEGTDDSLVKQLRKSESGTKLLSLLGDIPKVDKWREDTENARDEAYREAQSAGTARGKAMYTPITATAAPGILADPNQPPVRKIQAQTVLDIVAMQKERIERSNQSVKAGDPDAAGKLMADGDLALSELKSRGATPDFIAKAVNAAIKVSGGKYNAQQADAQFKVAGNEQNVSYFSAAKSLVKKDGTLDQFLEAQKALGNTDIPYFNDWEQALKYQAGNPALSSYLQIAIGVADEYATVMSKGNQPGQQMLLEQLNSMSRALNDKQAEGLVRGMKGTVTAQATSRFDENWILKRMYGHDIVPESEEASRTQRVSDTQNQTPEQQKLQSITMPGGGHPKAIRYGQNGATIVWSGRTTDSWVDLATGKPVK